MSLSNKIDFAVVFSVTKANPNGDPLNGNRPRVDYNGLGEVSDVCLKRKLRNRLQDLGENIFVQSDDNRQDECRSLKDRFDNNADVKAAKGSDEKVTAACNSWYDVRAFGQVFAFKKKKGESGSDSVSVGVRGPVSIQGAISVAPVDIYSQQITKSVNLETDKTDPDKKAPDAVGMKHYVEHGIYATYGSINCQLAGKTGFSDADAELFLESLKTMFVNDESSARPSGSMEVLKVIWWKHNSMSGQYPSAKVHRSLNIDTSESPRYPKITVEPLPDLEFNIYDGE